MNYLQRYLEQQLWKGSAVLWMDFVVLKDFAELMKALNPLMSDYSLGLGGRYCCYLDHSDRYVLFDHHCRLQEGRYRQIRCEHRGYGRREFQVRKIAQKEWVAYSRQQPKASRHPGYSFDCNRRNKRTHLETISRYHSILLQLVEW